MNQILSYTGLINASVCFLLSIVYSSLIPKSELGPFQKCVTLMILTAFSITNIITYLTATDEKADACSRSSVLRDQRIIIPTLMMGSDINMLWCTPSIILTIRYYMMNDKTENPEIEEIKEKGLES